MNERKRAEEGGPQSHEKVREIVTGIAAAEAEKLFETKGLDYLDRERTKQMAVEQASKLADEQYGSEPAQ
ncbi:hypothetical protein HK102_011127 [Quaeritorhiza haematococci]|nr:hypothetical protein HK102_011127 [Quaeritorhiza haematococci]